MASNIGLWGRLAILLLISIFFAACDGDDGAAGAPGADGADGADGAAGPAGPGYDADPIAAAKVESCSTCHGGVGDEKHQALYNKYTDGSADAGTNLTLAFTGYTSVAAAVGFDVTLTIEITQDGLPLVNINNLGMTNRFYVTRYDSTTGQYFDGNQRIRTVAPTGTPGEFVVSGNISFDPNPAVNPDVQFFGYIGDEQVIISDVNYAAHMGLYDNIASASLATGVAGTDYQSAANVSGCETCHGTPYMKHGNRVAAVAGLPDFAACKSCHYDDRTGGHTDWQYMVDEPFNWATGVAETADYSYTANVMNDTHMSHAMEFPYPQSMANCNTCHENKLTQVLDNSNFTGDTCLSCHPVQGIDAWPGETYAQSHRAPPLEYLWTELNVQGFHDPTADCQACHGVGVAPAFDEYHSGYDVEISNAAGERYADLYTVSIDDVSLAGDVLTISYSASDPAIVPEVLVSFYGWDSKQFIIPSHARDGSDLCPSSRGDGCRFEYEAGDTSPLFPSFQEVLPGSWVLTADMAAFVPVLTDDIPTMIANGDVKKAEITVTPELTLTIGGEDVDVALDAVTQTVDIVAGGFVADYFKGANAVVDTAKCNVCHDQLAVTFHSGSGRGGDIVACKNCHAPVFTGSHLEMASRSIENYVHAIHSFQDFDPGSTFAAFDPVDALRYDHHIDHTFPNFTITNCEACHNPGTYNVPEQSESMPGVLSVSDDPATWYAMVGGLAVEDTAGRNISGSVPEFVTGPASRACGACHRAHEINEDRVGDLAAFNAHTEAGGTFVENDAEDTVLYGVIDKIMSLFE
jgi:OmcA/MtrC family decaheme c-type cytochrome